MPYVVETAQFKAEGAFVDWAVQARRLGHRYDGKSRYVLQLRWMIHKDLGMPTEPFIVWRRAKTNQGPVTKVLTFTVTKEDYLFGSFCLKWPDGPMCRVVVDVQAPNGGMIIAYAGSPTIGSMMQWINVAAGNSTITIEAPEIDGLILGDGITATKVSGIPVNWLADAAGWEKLEIVGLPVVQSEWTGIGKWNSPQGMAAALTDPGTAALQRLTRGGAQVGWGPTLPGGQAVPAWVPPNFPLYVSEARLNNVNRLKPIMQGTVPNEQITKRITLPATVENSSGQQMPNQNNTTTASPLALLLIAGSADPWASLALGFGTAYVANSVVLGSGVFYDVQMYDYMITARWEKGLNGASTPLDMAAILPTPTAPLPPPTPANINSVMMGHIRPAKVDDPWRCSVMTKWDRLFDNELIRPRTYAFMRAGLNPVEPVVSLMQPRTSGGVRDIVISGVKSDPLPADWWQLNGVDRELSIPSSTGMRALRYGIAQQDIWGQWSQWASTDITVQQPDVDAVRLVEAALRPTAAAGLCPATLTLEFLWDWSIRRPHKISFVGKLYAANNHGDPPPNLIPPAVLERKLDGTGSLLAIQFNGDAPNNVAGVQIIGLSEDGEHDVGFGPQQGSKTRRYRVRVSGFLLDFSGTGHVGLAIWAKGQERILPQREGNWSAQPSVTSTSDPRPPVMQPDIVELASLPDASGQCHAKVKWSTGPSSNAIGYFVYESNETKILQAAGLPEPEQEKTLSQRLTTVKNLFQANPAAYRSVFTRLTDRPVSGNSLDVALPKGTTSIHIYVVLGMSAGQVESQWPSGVNADEYLQAIAAPLLIKPAPPTLEVRSYLDTSVAPPLYRAAVVVGARPGPRVSKVELFRVRVDDAAKQLETMGPPLATISSGGGGWNVSMLQDGSGFAEVEGSDTPGGSWKRVWYRATAWAAPDDLRGQLGGRSGPSSAASVVIPPPTAPDLSAILMTWPQGGQPGDVLLEWSSNAPLRRTPLGSHVMSVRAKVVGGANVIDVREALDKLPVAQPPSGSGVWLKNANGPKPYQYAAYIRRAAPTDAIAFVVRITDPLGRDSDQVIDVPSGSVLPPPSVENLSYQVVASPAGVNFTFESAAPLSSPSYYVRVRTFAAGSQVHNAQLEMPLPMVPPTASWPPPGVDPLRIRRVPGGGPTYVYQAFCRVPVQQCEVRMAAPDGTTIEKSVTVS